MRRGSYIAIDQMNFNAHQLEYNLKLIPELIKCKVDVLEPIQKVKGLEPEELYSEFGGKIAFHGGIDTQYLLPFGTAEEVKEEVKEVVREATKAPAAKAEAKAADQAQVKTAAKADAIGNVKAAPKAEIEKTVVVEFGGKQIKAKDVLAQAEKAYAESHPETEIKTVELYISPEQNAAYYVVNGEASDDFKIEL